MKRAKTVIVWNVYDGLRRADLAVFFDEADAIAFARETNAASFSPSSPTCQVERTYLFADNRVA